MPKLLPYTTDKESGPDAIHYLINIVAGEPQFGLTINRQAPFNTSIFDNEFWEEPNYQTFLPEDVAFTISTIILAHMNGKPNA